MSIFNAVRALPRRLSQSLHRQSALRSLPGPSGHPLLGNLRELEPERAPAQLNAWGVRHGPIFRCRVVHRTVVVVTAPSLVQEVLRQRPRKVRRVKIMESAFEELGLNGVISAEGDDWLRQRRLVNAAFSRSGLVDMQAMIVQVTDRLLDRWEGVLDAPCDVYPDLIRFAADIATLTSFGYDLDSLGTDSQLQHWVTTVFDGLVRRSTAPFPYWRVFELPRDRELREALALLRSCLERIVRESDPGGPDNLLRQLQEARLEEHSSLRGLSDQELFANVVALLFAGEDTTASTLGWMIHYLAAYPDVQESIRREVDEVLGDAIRVETPEQVKALRSIRAAFVETLRLRPVTPLMLLQTIEDLSLGGYLLPASTEVVVVLDHESRSPSHFSEPDEFRIERWLGSKINLRRPSDVLFPFGGGSRVCPGRSMAAQEVQTLLGSLLRRFEIHPAPGALPPKTIVGFTSRPDRIDVVLRPRSA